MFSEVKFYVILAAALGVVGGLIWLYKDGESRALSKEKDQQIAQLKADSRQKEKDYNDSLVVIQVLHSDLDGIRASSVQPVPIRLCHITPAPIIVQPGPGSSKSAEPPDTGLAGVHPVPPGDTEGADIGSTVSDLAYAGAICAAGYRAAYKKLVLESSLGGSK